MCLRSCLLKYPDTFSPLVVQTWYTKGLGQMLGYHKCFVERCRSVLKRLLYCKCLVRRNLRKALNPLCPMVHISLTDLKLLTTFVVLIFVVLIYTTRLFLPIFDSFKSHLFQPILSFYNIRFCISYWLVRSANH